MGEPNLQTPHLDGLISQGTCCLQNRHQGGDRLAVCTPTRAALHTGRGVHHASVDAFVEQPESISVIPADAVTLGQAFRQAGYETFFTGKWHNDFASLSRSFAAGRAVFSGGMSDHYTTPLRDFAAGFVHEDQPPYTTGRHSSEVFTDAALDFLNKTPADRPWLLCISYTAPHDPRQSPEPFASMYDPDAIPLPPNVSAQPPFDHGDLEVRDEHLAAMPRQPEEIRRHLADYYGILSHEDAQIGRLLKTLEAGHRSSRTIVAYTADHGLALGQHGLMGKQNLYEPSLRVPLILAGPGVPAGRRIDAPTQSHDLMPTLTDLAGIGIPGTATGLSLRGLMEGRVPQIRRYAFAAYRRFQRMVTDGRWKLIRIYRYNGQGSNRICLFDLRSDPYELHDLATDSASRDTLHRLAEALAAWLNEGDDPLAGVEVVNVPATKSA